MQKSQLSNLLQKKMTEKFEIDKITQVSNITGQFKNQKFLPYCNTMRYTFGLTFKDFEYFKNRSPPIKPGEAKLKKKRLISKLQ